MPGSTGPPMTTFRGPTAKGLLEIDWDYPVYTPPAEEADGKSSARRKRTALDRGEALAFIAGDDPRPLLVLRECKVCNGTDEALLKGGSENEKTYLLATWYHCVKLPADVLEEDHPFHALFLQEQPEHLFVSSVDGSNHDPLESQTSRKELWKSMRGLIAKEYTKKPDSALKQVAKLLDKLDAVDARWNDLLARRDAILEDDGPKSRKLPKIEKQLKEIQEERKELRLEVQEASKLELKKREAEAGHDADAD